MIKVALNAGHGLYTAGKRCLKSIDKKETREWVLNSRICNKVEEKLKSYTGYELIRLDDVTGKTDVSLKTRTNRANAFGADIYISIHHNAGIGGKSGGGVVAIVYPGVGKTTVAWQTELYNAIIATTGLSGNRSQPLQQQNLHEVRESKMTAVLLECGFMDSTTDTPIILTDAFADKVATAIVTVLVKKGNLAKKEVKTINEVVVNCFPRYTGNSGSIVTALQAVGANSAFYYRSKVAKVNGIKLYVGTANQNIALLALLKQGKLLKP